MRNKIFFSDRPECSQCTESTKGKFTFIDSRKGASFKFRSEEDCTLIFILSGKALISCNEFTDIPFSSKEICLLPISAQCVWKTLENTTVILLSGDSDFNFCDRDSFHVNADKWLNGKEIFDKLQIKPRMYEFLCTLKNYLNDGITCPMMHIIKQKELSMIFRAYYKHEELVNFFLPTVKSNRRFEMFVMKNYLKIKGVKEFVDLSGLNLSTFNRKFKTHFGMSPYQWLIKQKSKHILHELKMNDKSISEIVKEFNFSDASHFNRYCKSMFGASPSEIRRNKVKSSIE